MNFPRARTEGDMKRWRAIIAVVVLTASGVAQINPPQSTGTNVNVIAVVLGKPITADQSNALNGLIVRPLLEQFAKENKIEPTAAEVDALLRKTEEMEQQRQRRLREERTNLVEELKSTSLSGRDREQKESRLKRVERSLKLSAAMQDRGKGADAQTALIERRQVVEPFVQAWKVNKALHEKYGGRVVFQQAGVEPLDAYRNFLKEQEANGAFQILDNSCRASFWGYFTNDAGHTFYSKDEGVRLINTPWWMQGQAPGVPEGKGGPK